MEVAMKGFFVMALAALIAGCGGETAIEAEVSEDLAEVQTVYLTPVDSIGIEMGDSSYVLGAVEGVAFGPDGNIAVLDCARSSILIYTPGGEYVRAIGGKGNGPGELQNVAFLGISQDGHITLAGEGSEILGFHQFDYSTGEWLGSYQIFGSPPTGIEGAEDSSYVRKDITLDASTGEPLIAVSISKYRGSLQEPEITYYEDLMPFDPTRAAEMIELIWFGYDVAADFSGNVYIAPRSSEDAVVFIYEPDGSETGRIHLDLEPVLRTEDELEMERMILTTKATIMDFNTPPIEPDPYKPMIVGLEIDGDGNIWVQHGGPSVPTFSVFSGSGVLLYNAEVSGNPPDGNSWRFFIDGNGILAYPEDPACGYQKVYTLGIVAAGDMPE